MAKAEGLEVSEQELDFYFQQVGARTGQDFYQLKKHHMENNLMFQVRDKLLADKATDLIYAKAKVAEVPAGSLSGGSEASEQPAGEQSDAAN